MFALSPADCVQLALRNPAFIGLPYEQLQGAVEAVSEALEVGLQEAGKVVIKCPGLVRAGANAKICCSCLGGVLRACYIA